MRCTDKLTEQKDNLRKQNIQVYLNTMVQQTPKENNHYKKLRNIR